MSPAPFASPGSASGWMRQRRSWWLDALEACAEAGDLAAEGGELGQQEAFVVAGVAARAGEVPFPLPYASASAAAAGFHQLVRGFNSAARGELRSALGLAMAAAARCCRRMIELDVEEQAAATRRRLGED